MLLLLYLLSGSVLCEHHSCMVLSHRFLSWRMFQVLHRNPVAFAAALYVTLIVDPLTVTFCDNRSVRCDCGYNEWICIRPVAEYFLTVLITFPSVAVCVVGSLLYIFECSRGLNLILADRIIVLVCDAVTVCRDYIIVTCSTFCITGKECSCFVANNFNAADHWSTWFFCRICHYSRNSS